jgi:N-glycosylase/DNA lyase
MENLRRLYREREREIKSRLRDFEIMRFRPEKAVFRELCFCLLTPGTSALKAEWTIRELAESGLLFCGGEKEISLALRKRIRFHNQKARNIVKARKMISRIKKMLKGSDNRKMREWLVDNVRGLGWKEASHFLRNVGHGNGLAIIDRHILKNLMDFGFIDKIPENLTKKQYFQLEEKIKEFSSSASIPMEELDLLLWSKETGMVFK